MLVISTVPCLLTADNKYCSVTKCRTNRQEVESYAITVEDHLLYISSRDILVHNVAPIAALFSEIIVVNPAGIAIVAAVTDQDLLDLEYIHGYDCYREQEKNEREKANSSGVCTSISAKSSGPKKDDDKDFFKKIKTNADEFARSIRFGKLYRDPCENFGGLKDRAGHGGSSYKVFKEGAKGFEWQFDADALGTRNSRKT